MNASRYSAARTIFEEAVVISGGNGDNIETLNTVKAYHPAADAWTYMPNMVKRKF